MHSLPLVASQVISLLAEMLVAARKSLKLRQSDLAQRVGVSRQTIARMEKGDATVAMGVFVVAAWVLDVPIFPGIASNHPEKDTRGVIQLIHYLNQQLPKRVRVMEEKRIDDDF